MVRLVFRAVIALVANAVGLLVADLLLDNFELDATALVIGTLIFTAVTVILSPLITKIALTSAPYLMGGIALVTTLIGLAITEWLTDGLSIDGLATWAEATGIIWIASMLGNLLIPWILIKANLMEDPDHPSTPQVQIPPG